MMTPDRPDLECAKQLADGLFAAILGPDFTCDASGIWRADGSGPPSRLPRRRREPSRRIPAELHRRPGRMSLQRELRVRAIAPEMF